MIIDYALYRQQLETSYEDQITVRRHGKSVVNGETVLGWNVVYESVPCRISNGGLGKNGQTETVNDIAYETKLFISPDVLIKQGDKCTANRNGIVIPYTAGEPFPYPTHQEISLQRKDEA